MARSRRPSRGKPSKRLRPLVIVVTEGDNAVSMAFADREMEGDPQGNPSTSMHVLMERIRTQGDS